MDKLIVSTAQVASFFEVSKKTVNQWRHAGCPREAYGRFDLKAVFDWWWDNLAADRAARQGGDESLAEAKRLYWWEKAEGEKIKNQQAQGNLIPREEIAREWAWRVSEVANGLSAFAKRLPPLLEGKDQSAMFQIIENEAWKLRDNFCRTGRFCPADAAQKALEGFGGESKPAKKQAQGGRETGSKSNSTGQKTRSSSTQGKSRYGKTTSTRSKAKKGRSSK